VKEFRANHNPKKRLLKTQKGVMEPTDFGRLFAKAVGLVEVVEMASPPNAGSPTAT